MKLPFGQHRAGTRSARASRGTPRPKPQAGGRRSSGVPIPWIIAIGLGFGVAAGISLGLAGNYAGVLLRQARDAYVVRQLTVERDALALNNDRLLKELALVKQKGAGGERFTSTVMARLNELQSIIEASTPLRMVKLERGKGRGSVIPVVDTDEPSAVNEAARRGAGSDAAPEGKKRRGKRAPQRVFASKLDVINKGLGGAEVECRPNASGKVVCGLSVDRGDKGPVALKSPLPGKSMIGGKKLVSLNGAAPVNGVAGLPSTSAMTPEQHEIVERLLDYTKLLRALPMGTPVEGELSSGFGHRSSPFSGRSSFHEGLDISLDTGSDVLVTGDGVVSEVAYDGTYGWRVDVEHSNEIVTRYAHLSKVLVREGQSVKRGDLLAYSGSTGRSTGPHLHYEVRFKGLPKNPMPFLALADRLGKFL